MTITDHFLCKGTCSFTCSCVFSCWWWKGEFRECIDGNFTRGLVTDNTSHFDQYRWFPFCFGISMILTTPLAWMGFIKANRMPKITNYNNGVQCREIFSQTIPQQVPAGRLRQIPAKFSDKSVFVSGYAPLLCRPIKYQWRTWSRGPMSVAC